MTARFSVTLPAGTRGRDWRETHGRHRPPFRNARRGILRETLSLSLGFRSEREKKGIGCVVWLGWLVGVALAVVFVSGTPVPGATGEAEDLSQKKKRAGAQSALHLFLLDVRASVREGWRERERREKQSTSPPVSRCAQPRERERGIFVVVLWDASTPPLPPISPIFPLASGAFVLFSRSTITYRHSSLPTGFGG